MFSIVATLRIIHGLWRLFLDPNRLDEVFEVASALETPELLDEMAAAVAETPHGAEALRTKHRLGQVDVDALMAMEKGTLGRSFAEFLAKNGLDPAPLTDQADREGEYLIAHLYETHDLWHVLSGYNRDPMGELGVLAFSLGQFRSNGFAFILANILWRSSLDHWRNRSGIVTPILPYLYRAYRAGRRDHAFPQRRGHPRAQRQVPGLHGGAH